MVDPSNVIIHSLITHITVSSTDHHRNISHSLPQIVRLPNTPLHRRPLRNAVNPLLQVREVLHLLLSKARLLPTLDPGPGLDVRDAVFAFTVAGQVLAGFSRVFARELNFEHAVGAQGFFFEALDGVGDLLGGGAREVVYLAC